MERPNVSFCIGNDSTSINAKGILVAAANLLKLPVNDIGTNSIDPVDYPDIAMRIMENVLSGKNRYGISISDIGSDMALVASPVRTIRQCVCMTGRQAEKCKAKLNANFYCIPASAIADENTAKEILLAIATTEFDEGAALRRLGMIEGKSE